MLVCMRIFASRHPANEWTIPCGAPSRVSQTLMPPTNTRLASAGSIRCTNPKRLGRHCPHRSRCLTSWPRESVMRTSHVFPSTLRQKARKFCWKNGRQSHTACRGFHWLQPLPLRLILPNPISSGSSRGDHVSPPSTDGGHLPSTPAMTAESFNQMASLAKPVRVKSNVVPPLLVLNTPKSVDTNKVIGSLG